VRSSASDQLQAPALSRAGWGFIAAAAALVIGFPMLDLIREVVSAGWSTSAEVLGSDTVRGPLFNTLWTATLVTVITVAAATAIAVATSDSQSRGWVTVVMVAPLIVPPFVSALSWVAAYAPGGLLDDLSGVSFPWLMGPTGVVMVLVASAMPIAYLIAAAALDSRTERDLVRSARISGASPRVALRTITLPLLRPALIAAGAITFIMSVNAFGVPAVLGTPARFSTATTRLYQDLVFSADPAAFDRVLVLALFLALCTLVVVAIADIQRRRPIGFRIQPFGPRGGARRAGIGVRLAVGVYAIVTLGGPLVALVLTSLTRGVGVTPTPSNWTLEHYREAFDAGAGSAFGTSFVLAVAAATTVLALAALLVALERRRRSGMATVAALGFAVPGSVLAVAVLLAYGPWLRDTTLIILLAYVAKFWALGHRPVASSADSVSPEFFGSARLSGASAITAIRTITVPLLRPALVVAWLLVFLFALHELTMSSLLYGPGSATLAVTVLNLRQLGDPTTTSALAVLLTVGVVAVGAPLAWMYRRSAS
jgi:iron(III) transport system permease protein